MMSARARPILEKRGTDPIPFGAERTGVTENRWVVGMHAKARLLVVSASGELVWRMAKTHAVKTGAGRRDATREQREVGVADA